MALSVVDCDAMIAEFSESARAGRAPAVTSEDGRETVRIFEGIYRDRKKAAI